ncbi:CE1 family esterase [Sulfitobacter guttiformis]|uniref:Polyhydroxybutyrate depolymerase n=1 Tax=Sulfitobacter guttiformis TaxID=74349 RepID=A0A420DIJ5_9RHOB|nr:PHB depolymerase family esterase [Sulfitobacter guttiformis]KIN72204.1 Secreted hydrolase [Sulfitobacter guttiformis KCTC 32187]RKE94025.1 polyhydroxybutyrate depolymerase [Sulfitobacter guttiformis]
MRFLSAAVIALLLTLCPAVSGAAPATRVTDGRITSLPAPLVVVLHGFTASGPAIQRKTNFDALARANGFIVAYPSGPRRRWDDRSAASADVKTLSALIASLIAEGRADPGRIYLAGHSNGGGMAMRMACARPDLIRAIAVVAMNAPTSPHCAGPPPIMAALFIHGTEDPIVPAQGLSGTRRHAGVLTVEQTLSDWAERNRCAGPVTSQTFNQTGGATKAILQSYQRCAEPLLHIILTGHGHEWPGAGPRATWIQGPASRELDAAAAIWGFFAPL